MDEQAEHAGAKAVACTQLVEDGVHQPIAARWDDRLFNLGLTLAFAIWVLLVSAHHEPWRDEADAWLAARDMSVSQLFRWLGGAGTPGLWYLLLMPFAKLGVPYESMSWVHSAIAIAGAALVAFLSPFRRPFKTLLVFSYFLSYEYAVVARSYALTCLLLFLIAIVLTANVTRYWLLGVLLFFLFNANVHGFFFAGIIGAVITVQAIVRRELSRSTWIGMAIAVAGAGLAVVQLASAGHAYDPAPERRWTVIGYSIADAFLPYVFQLSVHELHAVHHPRVVYLAYFGTCAAGAIVAISALYLMRRVPAAVAIVLGSWLALQYIGVFQWYGNARHAGLFFIIIVFGLWLAKVSGEGHKLEERPLAVVARRTSYAVLMTSLAVSCTVAAIWSYRDLRRDYSGAEEAATFLRDPAFETLPIAAGAGEQPESILPYLPGRQFWYAGRRAFGTYTAWERDWRTEDTIPQDEVLARVRHKFSARPHLLLLPLHPLGDSEAAGYRLLFKNSRHIFPHAEESYYIYAAVRPAPAPDEMARPAADDGR